MAGRSIGHYELLGELGAGGMGVVYRARDTRLDREVAIKALPEDLAGDPERLARFEREAKVLASLNHPNIASIHGMEKADGQSFLILELVEGESLEERIAAGPIPVREALKLGCQIAEALEFAHDQGIVHRDLKPANVKVTHEGKAKVLDFGLAKAVASDIPTSAVADSPTLTADMTRQGVLLGTAAYMSPEQARGQEATKQSDIWSFGCLLYEMLAGSRIFGAPTTSEMLAATLRDDPDWSGLPASTPVQAHDLLRRALRRDARRRLHSAADARIHLEEALADPRGPAEMPASERAAARSRPRLAWVALASLLGVGLGWAVSRIGSPATMPPPPIRSAVELPQGQVLRPGWASSIDISPDGQRLVYATSDASGGRIYVRDLAGFESVALPGSEEGQWPFFSPDGQWVGFFSADRQLMKVPAHGGAPLPICQVGFTQGGTWGESGTIVFSSDRALYAVSATGGAPRIIAEPDPDAGENGLLRPSFLPGGEAVAFVVDRGAGTDVDQVAAVRVDGTGRNVIADNAGGQPRSIPGQRLLFGRSTSLLAIGFDPGSLKVTTPEPIPLLTGANEYHVAVSSGGTLVYQLAAQNEPAHLYSVDRRGQARRLTTEPKGFRQPRLSPSGDRILVVIQDPGGTDLWTFERSRSALSRLTFDGATTGVWLPGGKEILYSTYDNRLWRRPADGGGDPVPVRTDLSDLIDLGSVTPDGAAVTVTRGTGSDGVDLWLVPLGGSEPRSLVQTKASEGVGMVSPDGVWLAYVSDASGRAEVYVQRFLEPGGRKQISVGGGVEPHWSRDGSEILYRWRGELFAVPVKLGVDPEPEAPEQIFRGAPVPSLGFAPNYDVRGDGSEFIIVESISVGTDSLRLVQNWLEELEQLLPARR